VSLIENDQRKSLNSSTFSKSSESAVSISDKRCFNTFTIDPITSVIEDISSSDILIELKSSNLDHSEVIEVILERCGIEDCTSHI
jgi:hypothetical protein